MVIEIIFYLNSKDAKLRLITFGQIGQAFEKSKTTVNRSESPNVWWGVEGKD